MINIYLHSKTLIVNSGKHKLILRVTNLKDAAFGGGHTWQVLVDWFCRARQLNALVVVVYTAVIIYSSLRQELRKCSSEYVHFSAPFIAVSHQLLIFILVKPHKCRLIPELTCKLQLARQDAKIMCNNEH